MAHATDRADRFAQRLVDRHHKALASSTPVPTSAAPAPPAIGLMTLSDVQSALKRVQAMRNK